MDSRKLTKGKFAASQDVLQCSKATAITRLDELGFDGMEVVVPDGIHETGANGLELSSEYPDPKSDVVFSPADRNSLKRQADAADIELTSICLSFLNKRKGLTSKISSERKEVRRLIERAIAAASDLGVSTVLLPFFEAAKIGSAGERVCNELFKLLPEANRTGVTLALETDLTALENLKLIEELNSKYIKIYYDVGNTTWFGYDAAEEIRLLGDAIEMVHLKDGCQGHSDARLGEGKVDFESIANALRTIGYNGWYVLETSAVSDPIEDLRSNLMFARAVFDGA